MIKNLLTDGWYCSTDFCSMDTLMGLRAECENRSKRPARISQDNSLDESIRSDSISWLKEVETNAYVLDYLSRIKELKTTLNRELYLGLQSDEFHFACYQKGGFYKRHLDAFEENNKRVLSVITYLNTDWRKGDGGELKLYLPNTSKIIEPRVGNTIIFMSEEIEHEVRPSHKKRLSLTGWIMKR